jgi:hypothetical protein
MSHTELTWLRHSQRKMHKGQAIGWFVWVGITEKCTLSTESSGAFSAQLFED